MRWVFGFLVVCYLALAALVGLQGHITGTAGQEGFQLLETVSKLHRLRESSIRMQGFVDRFQLTGQRVWVERYTVEKDVAGDLLKELTSGRGNPGMTQEFRDSLLLAWQEFTLLADSAIAVGQNDQGDILATRASLRQENLNLLLEQRISNILSEPHNKGIWPWVLVVIALFIAVLGLGVFLRFVAMPTRQLAIDTQRIAFGDLDAPITVRAPGSIGALAQALEHLRINLIETREQVKRIISRGPNPPQT